MTLHHCTAFCGWQGHEPAPRFPAGNPEFVVATDDECPSCGADVAEGTVCRCKQAPAMHGSDDCVRCSAAYYVLEDMEQYLDLCRRHAGEPWLAELRREVERLLRVQVAA